jgi:endoglucanase
MRKIQLTLLAVFAMYTALSQSLPRISVKGNKFIDENGKTFIFRGLNCADPDNLAKGDHWNASFFEEMARWGANVVRFPVHPRAWRERGKKEYMALLDEGIKLATANKMYVIIDWHSIGNLRSQLYQADMYETTQKETFEFWRTMASTYKDNSTVAFFELFNEPTVARGQLGACSWQQWKELNEEMITIIRANGGKAIPLVAGFNWAYSLTDVATAPIAAEGIAYVSHPYPQKRQKPWEAQWTADWGYVAEKYPLILTEVGFSLKDEPGAHIPVIDDGSYGPAITKYCDDRGISWVVWVFDQRWAPRLFSDWNYTPTTHGVYFKKALQDRKNQ